jgi:hypothetical protein
MLLELLRLTSFLSLYIGLEHGLHESHTIIAPKLPVGLLGLRGLTCCCWEGLTFAVIAMAVQGVVGLVGAAVQNLWRFSRVPARLSTALASFLHCTMSPFWLMRRKLATTCARYSLVFPWEKMVMLKMVWSHQEA